MGAGAREGGVTGTATGGRAAPPARGGRRRQRNGRPRRRQQSAIPGSQFPEEEVGEVRGRFQIVRFQRGRERMQEGPAHPRLVGEQADFVQPVPVAVMREDASLVPQVRQQGVDRRLKGQPTPRPQTHELLSDVIEKLNGRLERILINDLQEHTFFAKLVIRQDGKTIEIDSRPSDAIALGVANNVPIFVAEHVLDQVG